MADGVDAVRIPIAVPVALSIAAGGCQRAVEQQYAPHYEKTFARANVKAKYSFGVPPVGTIGSLWRRYSELISVINALKDSPPVKLESALTSEAFESKIAAGSLDFAIIDPAKVLTAEQCGYKVIARSNNGDRIRGVVIVNADSPVRRLTDLNRRTVAFISRDDLAGTMLTEMELLDRGINVRRRINRIYAHSAESALMSLSLDRADAAAVPEKDWLEYAASRPDEADALKVLLRTGDLSGPAVMAASSVSKEDADRMQRVLAELDRCDQGRQALRSARISGFTAGDSASYDDVWEFLVQYRIKIGAIEN